MILARMCTRSNMYLVSEIENDNACTTDAHEPPLSREAAQTFRQEQSPSTIESARLQQPRFLLNPPLDLQKDHSLPTIQLQHPIILRHMVRESFLIALVYGFAEVEEELVFSLLGEV